MLTTGPCSAFWPYSTSSNLPSLLAAFVLFGYVSFCECNVSSVAVSPPPPPPSLRVSAAASIQRNITTFRDRFTETFKNMKKIDEFLFAVGMSSVCARARVRLYWHVNMSPPIVICNFILNCKKKPSICKKKKKTLILKWHNASSQWAVCSNLT